MDIMRIFTELATKTHPKCSPRNPWASHGQYCSCGAKQPFPTCRQARRQSQKHAPRQSSTTARRLRRHDRPSSAGARRGPHSQLRSRLHDDRHRPQPGGRLRSLGSAASGGGGGRIPWEGGPDPPWTEQKPSARRLGSVSTKLLALSSATLEIAPEWTPTGAPQCDPKLGPNMALHRPPARPPNRHQGDPRDLLPQYRPRALPRSPPHRSRLPGRPYNAASLTTRRPRDNPLTPAGWICPIGGSDGF